MCGFACRLGTGAAPGHLAADPPRGGAETAARAGAAWKGAQGGVGATAAGETKQTAEIIPGEPAASRSGAQECKRKCKMALIRKKKGRFSH